MSAREEAKAVHDIWAHWMRYQFSVCERQEDGSLVIPAEKVRRWSRQMETDFDLLSFEEQRSDYEIAEEFIAPLTGR